MIKANDQEQTVVVAAFPEQMFKLYVFNAPFNHIDMAAVIHDKMFTAKSFISEIDSALDAYNIHTIGLLGPAQYTQKLLTDLQLHLKDNSDIIIQMMGV